MGLKKPSYTQIPNEFIDKYMSELSKEAIPVFIAICRKTIGWHKETDVISQSQLINMTPVKSVNGLKKAIAELEGKGLIRREQNGIGKNIKTVYEINFIADDDVSQDNISSHDTNRQDNVSSYDTKDLFNVSPHDTTKDIKDKKNEYKETASRILLYLNSKTRKHYKPVNGSLKNITARLKEYDNLEQGEKDCKRVIDVKWSHWKYDFKMKEYVNYETLFRSGNFYRYLQEEKWVWLEDEKGTFIPERGKKYKAIPESEVEYAE